MLDISDPRPRMIVRSEQPYNAEPPLDRLRARYVTNQADFYVRSHGDVPAIDPASYRLRVDGLVRRPLDLSLDAIQHRYEHRTVTAVLQCAGNRRGDLQEVRPTSGDPWAPGAIGNARWTGVRLADILRDAGTDEGAARHVAFSALDEVEAEGRRFAFGVSVPLRKALSPEVLLAWAMDGEALTPAHGFPLRAVVPGFAGIRSPKWLGAITVQDGPSDNHMQRRDYKLFPPHVSEETADWDAGLVINEMPLNAAICEPSSGFMLSPGPLTIRGYACATARTIARVDVSTDGGRTWRQAELERDDDAPWSWTFWSLEADLPAGEHELVVRAWDGAGQTQPASPADTWNFKGYLSASWHRVRGRAG